MIRFPDPTTDLRDTLRTRLAATAAPEAAGAVLSTREAPTAGPKPHVRVSIDARSRNARQHGTALVRVTVWHRDAGLAVSLAALCEALLLGNPTPTTRAITPATGPVAPDGGDPDTGEPFASFTVTASLRPSN